MARMLTPDKLKQLLHYCPDTGVFTRLTDQGKHRAGDVVGCPTKRGHLRTSIAGKFYYLHRLAWLYTKGKWPTYGIDHIDGDVANNRLSNLRDVPHYVNLQNLRKARSDSGSQLIGAHKKGKQWAARIQVGGVPIHLGRYATPEEAHAVYLKAKRNLHEGCTI